MPDGGTTVHKMFMNWLLNITTTLPKLELGENKFDFHPKYALSTLKS